MKNKKIVQINRLATMLGIGAFTGAIPIAAISGLFKIENAFMLAVLFMAGPGAIATAVLLDGSMKDRMFAAVVAGLIATIIVTFAAGIGPTIFSFLNLKVLKIAGGISIGIIALLVAGVKIPENIPLWVMFIGLFLAGVLK